MAYGYFRNNMRLRRTLEVFSSYFAPAFALNMITTPVTLDNKQQIATQRPIPAIELDSRSAARRVIVSNHPLDLRVRPNALQGLLEKEPTISLSDFVRKHCTSLFEQWEPTWWLNSGHLQTFWSSAGNFADVDPIEYDRTILELPDGGIIGVDFSGPPDDDLSDDTPILIILPGLTGGSQASYVRTLLAITSKSRSAGGLGLRSVVINSRGCGNVPLRTPQISAGSPDDLRSALLFIREKYPTAPLFAVGFSLGATVLSKYLGQEGEVSEIRAGCVLACPWDLLKNSEELESQFLGRHLYSRALAKSYLALLHRSLPGLTISSTHHFTPHLKIIHTLSSPTFTTLNTHLTAQIGGSAPDFPHASVEDFYRWASCSKDIEGIRVPLLAINADDDPVVSVLPEEEVRENRNGSVVLVVTRGGGHLGWFDGDAKRRWISTPVAQWLRALVEEVVFPDDGQEQARRERIVGEDGFTRAKGEREEIGFRVLSEHDWQSSGAGGDTSVPGALAGL